MKFMPQSRATATQRLRNVDLPKLLSQRRRAEADHRQLETGFSQGAALHLLTFYLSGSPLALSHTDRQQQIRPQRLIRRLNGQHELAGCHRFVEVQLGDRLQRNIEVRAGEDLAILLPGFRLPCWAEGSSGGMPIVWADSIGMAVTRASST